MKKPLSLTGFSLLEMLVAVGIFAVLAIITTQTILLSIKGANKSEAVGKVKDNVDYAVSVIERNLRNSTSVKCINPSGTSYTAVSYVDQTGAPKSFSCNFDDPNDTYIAASSSRLTNNSVSLVSCEFSCTNFSSTSPSVKIDVKAIAKDFFGTEEGRIETSTEVFLRNY